MEMYKQLTEYYDNKDLSVLQSEWNQLDSHKYDKCNVLAEDLISSWDGGKSGET